MLVSAAMTLARALTNQDGANNDQLDDTTHLLPFVQLETETLRSQIADVAPKLYGSTTSDTAVTSGSAVFAKPADFKRPLRLERKSTQTPAVYYPVEPTDGLTPDISWLNWEEQQTNIVLRPTDLAAGTYRMLYETVVGTLTTGIALPVPPGGFEQVVIQRVCALIRVRLGEHDKMDGHLKLAVDTWKRLNPSLRKRTGEHPRPAMKRDRVR